MRDMKFLAATFLRTGTPFALSYNHAAQVSQQENWQPCPT